MRMHTASRQPTRRRDTADDHAHWSQRGACRNLPDPDMMLPPTQDTYAEMLAVAICQPCPVRDHCGRHALDIKQRDGVWGGMTERERAHRLAGKFIVCPNCRRNHYQRYLNQVHCLACRRPPAASRAERATPDQSDEEQQ